MIIEFWLIDDEEKFRFPVNPSVNTYTMPYMYEDFEVEGLGEVTNIKRKSLGDFTLETHFPIKYNASFCGYKDFPSPTECLEIITKFRDKRMPIRYIVTGEGGVNTLVTIRDITVNANKYGEPGDIYINLALKEYQDYTVTTIDLSKNKPTTGSNNTTKPRPSKPSSNKVTSYVVKANDCLWNIAKKKEIYGDGNQWRKIYNANKKTIGTNPNEIFPGQRLVIPR